MTADTAFQWSDLSKRTREVQDRLDRDGQVTVARNGSRYTIQEESTSSTNDLLAETCRLLSVVTTSKEIPDDVARAIIHRAWPWTRVLPEQDVAELLAEIGPAAEICASVGSWRQLTALLQAWQATARAWADGLEPVGPFNSRVDQGQIERPESTLSTVT